MPKIYKYGNFKGIGKSEDKNQIILVHTSRNIDDYFTSLKTRFNGKYNKLPNYVISSKGKIYQLLSDLEYSKFFWDERINKNSVIISLENLGWLNKQPLKDYYVNWIGDIYNGKVVDKKWRDFFFWQPYSDSQISSVAFLCKKLFKELNIEKEVIGHNTKINGIESFDGVVTRSNYDTQFTDVSPSFDFELFTKKIEDEQQT